MLTQNRKNDLVRVKVLHPNWKLFPLQWPKVDYGALKQIEKPAVISHRLV